MFVESFVKDSYMCGHCVKKKELVIDEGSTDISYAIVACNTTYLESLGKRLIQIIESQPKLACFPCVANTQ